MSRRDKSSYLFAMMEPQSRSGRLMFEANAQKDRGALKEAEATYRELETTLKGLLQLTEEHNADFSDSPILIDATIGQLVNAMTTRADLLATRGDAKSSDALRTEAIELSQRYLPPTTNANHRRQRAAALAADSRYHEAIVELLDAREILQTAGDELGVVQVGAQLAETYEWLGDRLRARDEAARAVALLEPRLPSGDPSMEEILRALAGGQLGDAETLSTVLKTWAALVQVDARLSRELGDYERAQTLFERVLPRVPALGKPGIEFQLARIDVEAGRTARGYDRLRALMPQMTGLYASRLGVLLSWLAEALLRMNRAEEAMEVARPGAEALEKQNDLDSMWSAQWRVARCLLALNCRREAYQWTLKAATTIRALRRAPLGYRLDSTYLADKLPVFDQAINLAVELNDPVNACVLIDAIKSRALTAILRTEQSKPEAGSEDRRFEELTEGLARVEHVATRDGWTAELKATQAKLLAERASVIEEIRIREPRWRTVTEAPDLDLPKSQANLADGDGAALTLYRRDDRVVAVLVTATGCEADVCTLAAATINDIERYRINLRAARPDLALFDPSALRGLDAAALVPEKLLDAALGSKSLVIVPHGAFHILPWAALKHRGRRLFEHAAISIAPNLSSLLLLRTRGESSRRVALIGAPDYPEDMKLRALELAGAELRAVQTRYQENGRGVLGDLIEGADARRGAFRQLGCRDDAGGAALHVVCHGDFVTGEPFNSGLLFRDGKVDAAEIARFRMLYDEVVLSACSTGYRPTNVQDVALSGDDIVGLVAAFFEAGVSWVVVSIPPAREDAALRFMAAYHTQRACGLPAPRAYQTAQQTLFSEGHYDPSLWVGYTLYGG